MIVLKCDKCGVIFDVPTRARDFQEKGDIWPGMTVLEINGDSKMALRADLCVPCRDEVITFFKAKKERAV